MKDPATSSGESVIGETDHKPLVPMLMMHMLNQLTPRIQRMRMRLMRFDIKQMVHVSGKQMYTSGTLSRLIARQPYKQPARSLIPDDMTAFIGNIIDTLPVFDVKLKQQIIKAQNDNEICKQINSTV